MRSEDGWRARLLWKSVGTLSAFFVCAFFALLLCVASPSSVDIEAANEAIPVDIDGLEPNKLYRFRISTPASVPFAGGNVVYLLKRTPEQIAYLEKHSRIKSIDRKWASDDPEGTRNVLRSRRADVFVFGIFQNGEWIRPSRRLIYDWLHDFARVIPGMGTYWRGECLGVIDFPYRPDIDADSYFTYDLAGRSVSPGLEPLMIPPHFYDASGRLVIGHQVREGIGQKITKLLSRI